jgi:hypothetical protein
VRIEEMTHMKKITTSAAVIAVAITFAAVLATNTLSAGKTVPEVKPNPSERIARGEYLVTIGGCNDCHTPWKMGPNGPENDRTRLLSGHPQDLTMPPPPKLAEPWGASASATFTAWAGPWGVSFAPNLTPDKETGLGGWTERNFIEAMRTGRHMGRGRPILPPMPWQGIGKMTDDDLKAMFAYLRSIPPIANRAPEPVMAEGAR